MEKGSLLKEDYISERFENIEEAVKCLWGIDGCIIERLAGYDTYNYLIQVTIINI